MREQATIKRIEEWLSEFDKPVLMSSFGKDSCVMLHIIFKVMSIKLPIIYHRDPWEPWKNDFADRMIKSMGLVVFDWPPTNCGVKVKDDIIEIVSRYQIGKNNGFDIPKNILEPKDGEPFQCGLEMISRPKCNFSYPWNLVFIGHRSADVDPFEGAVPLKTDFVEIEGAPAAAFPLKDWTDEELWSYIQEKRIIVQSGSRYDMAMRKDTENKLFNNDWITACTKCIDKRQPKMVYCPKFKKEIPNVSSTVLDLNFRPSYIEEAA
jgi:hypothetical protein